MDDDRALIEEAAASENTWVRACILKQEPPAEGSLLEIATRARDMAARSLGTSHPAYGATAAEHFAQARAVANDNQDVLAYGWQRLGIFHLQVNGDVHRAEGPLIEALAIQRRTAAKDDVQLVDTLVALALTRVDRKAAFELLNEALQLRRAKLPKGDPAITSAENLLFAASNAMAPPLQPAGDEKQQSD
jgi:hypothetical protein